MAPLSWTMMLFAFVAPVASEYPEAWYIRVASVFPGEIASSLYMSESTAKTHISKLYEKLGAGNRATALMTAMRLGLISADKSH